MRIAARIVYAGVSILLVPETSLKDGAVGRQIVSLVISQAVGGHQRRGVSLRTCLQAVVVAIRNEITQVVSAISGSMRRVIGAVSVAQVVRRSDSRRRRIVHVAARSHRVRRVGHCRRLLALVRIRTTKHIQIGNARRAIIFSIVQTVVLARHIARAVIRAKVNHVRINELVCVQGEDDGRNARRNGCIDFLSSRLTGALELDVDTAIRIHIRAAGSKDGAEANDICVVHLNGGQRLGSTRARHHVQAARVQLEHTVRGRSARSCVLIRSKPDGGIGVVLQFLNDPRAAQDLHTRGKEAIVTQFCIRLAHRKRVGKCHAIGKRYLTAPIVARKAPPTRTSCTVSPPRGLVRIIAVIDGMYRQMRAIERHPILLVAGKTHCLIAIVAHGQAGAHALTDQIAAVHHVNQHLGYQVPHAALLLTMRTVVIVVVIVLIRPRAPRVRGEVKRVLLVCQDASNAKARRG